MRAYVEPRLDCPEDDGSGEGNGAHGACAPLTLEVSERGVEDLDRLDLGAWLARPPLVVLLFGLRRCIAQDGGRELRT